MMKSCGDCPKLWHPPLTAEQREAGDDPYTYCCGDREPYPRSPLMPCCTNPPRVTAPKKKKDDGKREYAEAVTMTEKEHDSLVSRHGESLTNACVQRLNSYKLANGKRYKSDYHAINSWVIRAVKEDIEKVKRGGNALDSIREVIDEGGRSSQADLHGGRSLPPPAKP